MARRWLSTDFEATRRLLVELHLTSVRDRDLATLLAEWHLERTTSWQTTTRASVDQVKAFYLLLLGLSHVDSLSAIAADPTGVQSHVDAMIDALFAATSSPS